MVKKVIFGFSEEKILLIGIISAILSLFAALGAKLDFLNFMFLFFISIIIYFVWLSIAFIIIEYIYSKLNLELNLLKIAIILFFSGAGYRASESGSSLTSLFGYFLGGLCISILIVASIELIYRKIKSKS